MPEYFDHFGEEARSIAADCGDCAVRDLSLVEGTATHYVFCDRHHRELYARYAREVEAESGEDEDVVSPSEESALESLGIEDSVDPEAGTVDVDVGRVAAGIDGDEDDRSDAVHALAAVAAVDPERVVPAVEPLLRALELETGPGATTMNVTWQISDALGRAAAVDERTLERLVAALEDSVDWEGSLTSALEPVADDDPGRLLSAGEPVTRDGSELPAVVARYADAAARGEPARALRVLAPLAAHRPEVLVPVAESLVTGLREDDRATQFRTAATLGRIGEAEPEVLHEYDEVLADMCLDEEPLVQAGGAVALSYWPRSEAPPVERRRLRRLLREVVDPEAYEPEQIREAVAALGNVGTAEDRELLEWIQLPTMPESVHEAARGSVRAIDDRSGDDS